MPAVAASEIQSNEGVSFYPSYARLDDQGGRWVVHFHGVVYDLEIAFRSRAMLGLIRRWLKQKTSATGLANLERRLSHFMVKRRRRRTIYVKFADQVIALEQSARNGQFRGEATITTDQARELRARHNLPFGWLPFEAVMCNGDCRRFTGQVQLIGRDGTSIISDVDDTIKLSHIDDRRALLRKTFLEQFEPIPGMAPLYRRAAAQGAAVHYVSRSPWQLYPALEEFLAHERFPVGTMHLRDFRLRDSTRLSKPPCSTKLPAIEGLLAAYPRRRFVLVGDSGEKDPEIYGSIARARPIQIAGIFIRNVSGHPGDHPRYRDAFSGVPASRWQVYREANEIVPRWETLFPEPEVVVGATVG